jgi:cytochrome c
MWRALVLTLALAGPVTAQEFFSLKGHGGPIMAIAVSPSGRIATASFDNSVGIWTDGAPTWLEGHTAAVNTVLFPMDKQIFSGGDDFAVRQWSPESRVSQVLGRHGGKVTALAVAPHAPFLASASWDGTIGLWKIAPEGAGWTLYPPLREPTDIVFRGHSQGVNDVVFSDDGTNLYSASADGTIRVWDVTNGTERRVLVKHGFGVNTLILNEADGWLAYGAVDGVTRLVDPATGEDIKDFSLDRRPILAMAYHPPTQTLAVGDGEGYIMLIDTTTQQITRDFRATARGPIWALAFSPDGQNIHAGGIDDVMFSFPLATLDAVPQMGTAKRSFLQDPDTMSNGERQFKRKCSICHTIQKGSARRAGPSLHALFGRPAGTVADYSYSRTLQGSDIIWSDNTIDALFDLGPDHYIPGSKMPMQRITEPQDRADLIAYLRDATQPEDTE